MKNKIILKITIFSALMLNISSVVSQNLYSGIEIGSKGIKISVIDVDNIKKGDFIVRDFWVENVGIAKGLAKDGNLALEDISTAVLVVKKNYNKIKSEYGVIDKNIYIVGSSGVAMAKNKDILIDKIKTETNKELVFIDAEQEGKMLLKGSIPPNEWRNSLVLDIGGGNTKGGFVDLDQNNQLVFFPLGFKYGTVTLTEIINKKQRNIESLTEYIELQLGFFSDLRKHIKVMYESNNNKGLEREYIYMSGGALWAFFTLHNRMEAKENFSEFKLEDVVLYNAMINNNFKYFEQLAETDKEVAFVLKTYSQKHLISASNLLLVCLEEIPEINSKKLIFSKQGQIAWLVSYVVEQSKRIKKII